MNDDPTRTYHSPLRQRQAQQTRDLILEALTEFVAESGPDELSMQLVADRAGVNKRTLYRHFPDRAAMVNALTEQLADEVDHRPEQALASIDDLPELVASAFAQFETTATKIRAVTLLDSDPRRRSADVKDRSERWRQLLAEELPALTERQHHQLAAVLRVVGSSHSWLRLRDEFELTSTEAAEIAEVAVEAILEHARDGRFPRARPAS